jgi:hypothetical protein
MSIAYFFLYIYINIFKIRKNVNLVTWYISTTQTRTMSTTSTYKHDKKVN